MFEPIEPAQIEVLQPVTAALWRKVRNSFNWLYGVVGTLAGEGAQNGFFEIDSDADGVPDGWTSSLYPGGSLSLNTTAQPHGSQCVRINHPGGSGNGGGYLESDYMPVAWFMGHFIQFWLYVAEDVLVRVVFRWFDSDKVIISDSEPFARAVASNGMFLAGAAAPVDARFCKVRLIGGDSALTVAGSVFFDMVSFNRVVLPPWVPGVTATMTAATGGGTPEDTVSTTFNPGVAGVPVRLRFTGQISGLSGVVYLRCRVGDNYSNSITLTGDETETSYLFELPIPAADLTGDDITLWFQAGGTVLFGKSSNDMEIQFHHSFNLSRSNNSYL